MEVKVKTNYLCEFNCKQLNLVIPSAYIVSVELPNTSYYAEWNALSLEFLDPEKPCINKIIVNEWINKNLSVDFDLIVKNPRNEVTDIWSIKNASVARAYFGEFSTKDSPLTLTTKLTIEFKSVELL